MTYSSLGSRDTIMRTPEIGIPGFCLWSPYQGGLTEIATIGNKVVETFVFK